MLSQIQKYKDFRLCISAVTSEVITEFTKGIHVTANAVSRAMDTTNGGVLKHGGYHRVFGGHSIADAKMWSKYGFKFSKEIGKDIITRNGIPLPAVETAVNNGWIKAGFAQTWGSVNIGDIFASGLSAIDTSLSARKFINDRDAFAERSTQVLIKGAFKIATAATHANAPLMIMGACDVGISLYSKLESSVEFDFDEIEPGSFMQFHA